MAENNVKAANENFPEPRDRGREAHPEFYELIDGVRQHGNLEKALSDAQSSDAVGGAAPADESVKRQRELDAHDRLMARSAAKASRDTLHDSGAGKEPGVYTVHEARDRAAHTAPAGTREQEK